MIKSQHPNELVRENAELRNRLGEANDVIRAIRNDEVDALVVQLPVGERVYTLESAERPYRTIIEHMQEGALVLDAAGIILYSNPRFAQMAGIPAEKLIATAFGSLVSACDAPLYEGLLNAGHEGKRSAEMEIVGRAGACIPVYLTVSPLPDGIEGCVSLLVTDLQEKKRTEAVAASERLARSILENAAEALVVCDRNGNIQRANNAACLLARSNPVGEAFASSYPLSLTSASRAESTPTGLLAETLAGHTVTGVEAALETPNGRANLLITMGPLHEEKGVISGCVITLSDITALKRAESELREKQAAIETLNVQLRRSMSETHHRVKNNLQVIAGLIDLQVMEDTASVPTAELERIGSHVKSLAAIHDILTEEAKTHGDVEVVAARTALEKLLPLLQSIAGRRCVRLTLEDIDIPVKNGTALAILANELVSNAVKHGSGDIDVGLAVEEQWAELHVSDTGRGFAPDFDPSKCGNTGLDLIRSVAHWDLRGTVQFTNRPEGGAKVLVRFPQVEKTQPEGR